MNIGILSILLVSSCLIVNATLLTVPEVHEGPRAVENVQHNFEPTRFVASINDKNSSSTATSGSTTATANVQWIGRKTINNQSCAAWSKGSDGKFVCHHAYTQTNPYLYLCKEWRTQKFSRAIGGTANVHPVTKYCYKRELCSQWQKPVKTTKNNKCTEWFSSVTSGYTLACTQTHQRGIATVCYKARWCIQSVNNVCQQYAGKEFILGSRCAHAWLKAATHYQDAATYKTLYIKAHKNYKLYYTLNASNRKEAQKYHNIAKHNYRLYQAAKKKARMYHKQVIILTLSNKKLKKHNTQLNEKIKNERVKYLTLIYMSKMKKYHKLSKVHQKNMKKHIKSAAKYAALIKKHYPNAVKRVEDLRQAQHKCREARRKRKKCGKLKNCEKQSNVFGNCLLQTALSSAKAVSLYYKCHQTDKITTKKGLFKTKKQLKAEKHKRCEPYVAWVKHQYAMHRFRKWRTKRILHTRLYTPALFKCKQAKITYMHQLKSCHFWNCARRATSQFKKHCIKWRYALYTTTRLDAWKKCEKAIKKYNHDTKACTTKQCRSKAHLQRLGQCAEHNHLELEYQKRALKYRLRLMKRNCKKDHKKAIKEAELKKARAKKKLMHHRCRMQCNKMGYSLKLIHSCVQKCMRFYPVIEKQQCHDYIKIMKKVAVHLPKSGRSHNYELRQQCIAARKSEYIERIKCSHKSSHKTGHKCREKAALNRRYICNKYRLYLKHQHATHKCVHARLVEAKQHFICSKQTTHKLRHKCRHIASSKRRLLCSEHRDHILKAAMRKARAKCKHATKIAHKKLPLCKGMKKCIRQVKNDKQMICVKFESLKTVHRMHHIHRLKIACETARHELHHNTCQNAPNCIAALHSKKVSECNAYKISHDRLASGHIGGMHVSNTSTNASPHRTVMIKHHKSGGVSQSKTDDIHSKQHSKVHKVKVTKADSNIHHHHHEAVKALVKQTLHNSNITTSHHQNNVTEHHDKHYSKCLHEAQVQAQRASNIYCTHLHHQHHMCHHIKKFYQSSVDVCDKKYGLQGGAKKHPLIIRDPKSPGAKFERCKHIWLSYKRQSYDCHIKPHDKCPSDADTIDISKCHGYQLEKKALITCNNAHVHPEKLTDGKTIESECHIWNTKYRCNEYLSDIHHCRTKSCKQMFHNYIALASCPYRPSETFSSDAATLTRVWSS